MKITSPLDEQIYTVKRQWWPWDRKSKDLDFGGSGDSGNFDFFDLDFDFGDELGLLLIPFVLLWILVVSIGLLFLLPLLLGLMFIIGELLLVALLVPILMPIRSFFWPWNIRVYRNSVLVNESKVKGWFRSRRYIKELAARIAEGDESIKGMQKIKSTPAENISPTSDFFDQPLPPLA